MYKYSSSSLDKLLRCHKDLQNLFKEAIKYRDITIICGYRGKVEQDKAFEEGRSKLKWPQSKHNQIPSLAVDAGLWHPGGLHWDDIPEWRDFGNWLLGLADGLGIKVRWGADWNHNYDVDDERFKDFPHFELIKSGGDDE